VILFLSRQISFKGQVFLFLNYEPESFVCDEIVRPRYVCKEVAQQGTGKWQHNELLKKTPSALYEGRKDGGYNDVSTCRPCTEKTSAKNHGGNEKPRLTP
jgi:hypothetical protein